MIGFFVFHIGEGRIPHPLHNLSLCPQALLDFQCSLAPGKTDSNISSRMSSFVPLWNAVVDWGFPGSWRYPGDSSRSGWLSWAPLLVRSKVEPCKIEPSTFPPGVVHNWVVVVVKAPSFPGWFWCCQCWATMTWCSGIFICSSVCSWRCWKHPVWHLAGLATMAWHLFCRSSSLPLLPWHQEMGFPWTRELSLAKQSNEKMHLRFPSRYREMTLFFLQPGLGIFSHRTCFFSPCRTHFTWLSVKLFVSSGSFYTPTRGRQIIIPRLESLINFCY